MLLAAVPTLFYLAALFALLALWTSDSSAMTIAAFCAICGTVQLVRNPTR
jgi:hypothetical protein